MKSEIKSCEVEVEKNFELMSSHPSTWRQRLEEFYDANISNSNDNNRFSPNFLGKKGSQLKA